MKPISDDGRFELKGLMRAEDQLPVYEVCVVINTNLAFAPPDNDSRDEIESS